MYFGQKLSAKFGLAKPKLKIGQVLVNCFQIFFFYLKIQLIVHSLPVNLPDFFCCRFFILSLHVLLEFSPEFCPSFFAVLPLFFPSTFRPNSSRMLPEFLAPPTGSYAYDVSLYRWSLILSHIVLLHSHKS